MWEYKIIQQDNDGVLIQVDNGDNQYLTTEEYEIFIENRNKLNILDDIK
jgi:hypothetical protein